VPDFVALALAGGGDGARAPKGVLGCEAPKGRWGPQPWLLKKPGSV